MQCAHPDDLAALMRAYPQVSLPGRYPGDLRTTRAGAPSYTAMSAPLTLSHLRNSHEDFAQRIREDFTKYRDFRLSESMTTGRTQVTLWASGRITETTLTDRFTGHGKPILMERMESPDLAPPYEFLFKGQIPPPKGWRLVSSALSAPLTPSVWFLGHDTDAEGTGV